MNTWLIPVVPAEMLPAVLISQPLSAIVTAAAGAHVAKHGNRSVSSKSGSADVLETAGVNLNITPEQVAECIR